MFCGRLVVNVKKLELVMILLYHEGIHSYTQCTQNYNTYHLGEAQSSCPRSRHGLILHGKDEHNEKGIHGHQ
jgi:hypothetical protein